jgi:hypothetical protein
MGPFYRWIPDRETPPATASDANYEAQNKPRLPSLCSRSNPGGDRQQPNPGLSVHVCQRHATAHLLGIQGRMPMVSWKAPSLTSG